MTNDNFAPLEAGEPREGRAGGIRGGSSKTRFYRDQLKSNPGKWFVWKKQGKYASDTSGALRTLSGLSSLSGVDRSTIGWQATAQKQDDGTYTTYVRFTENDNTEPLAERSEDVALDTADTTTNGVVSNPFGVNV